MRESHIATPLFQPAPNNLCLLMNPPPSCLDSLSAFFVSVKIKSNEKNWFVLYIEVIFYTLKLSMRRNSLWCIAENFEVGSFQSSTGVANFFRLRAVFEIGPLGHTFKQTTYKNMIYKEIVLKNQPRGPYSGLLRAGFGPRAGPCPPLN